MTNNVKNNLKNNKKRVMAIAITGLLLVIILIMTAIPNDKSKDKETSKSEITNESSMGTVDGYSETYVHNKWKFSYGMLNGNLDKTFEIGKQNSIKIDLENAAGIVKVVIKSEEDDENTLTLEGNSMNGTLGLSSFKSGKLLVSIIGEISESAEGTIEIVE